VSNPFFCTAKKQRQKEKTTAGKFIFLSRCLLFVRDYSRFLEKGKKMADL